MNQIDLFRSLTVFFFIESVTALENVNLNYLTLETVVPLLNILSKYENDVKYVIIEPNKQKQNEEDRNSIGKTYHSRFSTGITDDYQTQDKKFHRPGKKTLIKRLIPHGLPTSRLEFDSKYKTYYRPLVRVHKRKRLPKIETILNIDGNTNGIDKYGIDVYDYFDNDENVLKFAINKAPGEHLKHFKVKKADENFDVDEELLQPFTGNFTESSEDTSTQLIILEEIQKLLKKIRSRSSKTKLYQDITKLLNKIISLRSHPILDEYNDPMSQGHVLHLETVEVEPPKPTKYLTHYAPWNFWTYKKTIYQDECPKGQVKIANLCIRLPPH